MKIKIEINQLVLDGFDHADDRGISLAIEQEMLRLITNNGLLQIFDRQITDVEGSSFKLKEGNSTESLGVQIARQIYGSIR